MSLLPNRRHPGPARRRPWSRARLLASAVSLAVVVLLWLFSGEGPLGRSLAPTSTAAAAADREAGRDRGDQRAGAVDRAPDGGGERRRPEVDPAELPPDSGELTSLLAAQRAQRDGVWVQGEVEVVRLLADDEKGSRHQRFLVRPAGGDTLLVAHNIDLAPRVPLEVGSELRVRGRFEWDGRGGGILHWTHHDPDGDIPGGWIELRGERYR
jgi:hypothetical protein